MVPEGSGSQELVSDGLASARRTAPNGQAERLQRHPDTGSRRWRVSRRVCELHERMGLASPACLAGSARRQTCRSIRRMGRMVRLCRRSGGLSDRFRRPAAPDCEGVGRIAPASRFFVRNRIIIARIARSDRVFSQEILLSWRQTRRIEAGASASSVLILRSFWCIQS